MRSLVIAALVLWGGAIQNSFFDNLFTLFGMDVFSLLLSVFLSAGLITFTVININRQKISEMILLILFSFYTFLGFLVNGFDNTTLLMFRTSLYFFSTFIILRNCELTDYQVIWLFRSAGLLNSAICLYFYFQNVRIVGAGFRDVSINLYFSILAISLSLFVTIRNEKKIIKYVISFLCIVAVITSQQRTQIIPLAFIFVFYIIFNIRFSLVNLLKIGLLILLIYITYKIADDIGVMKYVINRFINAVDRNSTLWIRTDAAQNTLSSMNIIQWLFGTGITGIVELEMILPNYLYKYGVLGSCLIISITLLPAIRKGLSESNSIRNFLLFSFFLISIGGFISGFGLHTGQLIIASIMSLLTSEKLIISKIHAIEYNISFFNRASKTLLRNRISKS
jgi:hypothetical protein